MAGFATMDHTGNRVPGFVLHVHQDRRAHSVQIPHVMGDVLKMPAVFAGIQIDRDQRVGVQVVSGALCAIQVRRRVTHHKEDGAGFQVDGRVHPDTTTQGLVEAAVAGQLRLLGGNVAVHIATGRIVLGPDAFVAFFRDGVEGPDQVPGLDVKGFDESADTVFATVGSNQNLAVHHGG